MRPLVIVGTGGHSKVVADAALACGRAVLGLADERGVGMAGVFGLKIVATDPESVAALCKGEDAEAVVAIGDNRTRARVFADLRRLGVPLGTVLHPRAIVSPAATVAEGTVVFAGVVVNPGACISENAILNTGVRLDHDCSVGAHAHLSPGVTTGGEVKIGEGVHLAVGVSVRNRVSIGAWSVVGVGAAVVTDIPAGVVAYGVPARVVRSLS